MTFLGRDPEVGIRVVLVDDDEMLRGAVHGMLEEQGFRVVGEAGSAEDAVKLVVEQQPDVALVDFRLQGSDGVDLTVLLKEQLPGLRVIMFTAYDERALSADAERAGVHYLLVKGCPPALIGETIRRAADRSLPI